MIGDQALANAPVRRARAFTLVELLVVVAVIAILAALLFPVLAQAREKGRQITCASNLKQLGNAIQMYTQDYGGEYPYNVRNRRRQPGEAEGRVFWVEPVYPYVKTGKSVDQASGVHSYAGVFHCPSDDSTDGPSYSFNAWFVDAGVREELVPRPAETVILAEKRGTVPQEALVWWIYPWPAWPAAKGTPINNREGAINAINRSILEREEDVAVEGVDPGGAFQMNREAREAAGLRTLRHNGGSNWLYCDGHVRWAKLASVWGNATTTNQLWPNRPEQ
jgi:prepilin-type processing-associated H-X9-DG protein/prepilin-type N-terminal cleavage/methylation domain-containing protein